MSTALDHGRGRAAAMMAYLGLDSAALLLCGRIIEADMDVADANCAVCALAADCGRHVARSRSGRPPSYCRNRVMLKELIRRRI